MKVSIDKADFYFVFEQIAGDCAALDCMSDADPVDDVWYYSQNIRRALSDFRDIIESAEGVEE